MNDSVTCVDPRCGKTFLASTSTDVPVCPHCGHRVVHNGNKTLVEPRPDADGVEETLQANSSALPAEPPGKETLRVGRLSLRTRLGEGAFGVVYRAHDPQLDREVAVKIAKPGTLHGERGVARFLREARAAARLRHPSIVPVYDAGQVDGQHYLTTAFIAGQTLQQRLRDGRPDFRETARIVKALAEALAYAHAQGVVHRDVKPGNIMVDDHGQPLLMDFGLAARCEDSGEFTHEGTVLGTPLYMPPEQAEGKRGDPLPASDQYSLGVLLYEMLCGQTPFTGSVEVILNLHRTGDVPLPSRVEPTVPRDLETICLKCLEKDPARRYPSCQELADDLRRWLEGEPIHARRLSLPERFVRWCRREPRLATAVGLALMAVVAVIVVLAVSDVKQRELRREAERQAARARAGEQKAREESERAEQERQNALEQSQRAEKEAGRARAGEQKAEQERRNATDQARRAETVAGFLRDLFTASDPTGLSEFGLGGGGERGRQMTVREVLDRGAKQIGSRLKDEPLTRAALMDAIGDVTRSLGLFDQAKPLLEEAVSLRRKQPGANPRDLAVSLHHLGTCLAERGSVLESGECYREALAVLQKCGAGDGLEAAETMLRYSLVLTFTEPDSAERLARRGLEIRRKLRGEEHRDVAIARAVLAIVLLDNGKEGEASGPALEAAAFLAKVGGGKDGAFAALVKFQEGMLFMNLGQKAASEKAFRQSLELLDKAFGPGHGYTCLVHFQLGLILEDQGKHAEAEKSYADSLAVVRRTVGLEHPRVPLLIEKYAELLVKLKKVEQGRKLLEELIEAQRRRYSTPVPWQIEALAELASFEAAWGDLRKGEERTRELLVLLEKRPRTLLRREQFSLHTLAATLCEKGDIKLLRQLHDEVLSRARELTGEDRALLVNTLYDWGQTLTQRKLPADAVVVLTEARDLLRRETIEARVKPYLVLHSLGHAQWGLRRFADAEQSFRDGAGEARKARSTRAVHNNLDRLALLLIQQGRHADALPVVRELQKLKQFDPLGQALLVHAEGLLCRRAGDTASHEKAVARVEQMLGVSPPAEVQACLARALASSGAAPDKLTRAAEQTEAAAKKEPSFLTTHYGRAWCLYRLGKHAEAAEALRKAPAASWRETSSLMGLIRTLAEHRNQPSPAAKNALRTAVKEAEQTLANVRSNTNSHFSIYYGTQTLETQLLLDEARKELSVGP